MSARLTTFGVNSIRFSLKCVRYFLLTLLLVCERIVATTLITLAFGSAAAIVLFRLIGNAANFPTGVMLLFAIGAIAMLACYRALILLLSGLEGP